MRSPTKNVPHRFPLQLAAISISLALPACDGGDAPKGAAPPKPTTSRPENAQKPPVSPPPPEVAPPKETANEPKPPHPGPFLWVTRSSAGVYFEAKPDREKKLGYVQNGGKVPVLPEKVPGENCSKGYYKLPEGGFICSMVGISDPNDPKAKFPPRQPNIEGILPYPYMRNAYNGTPLYRTIPSKEQMYEYEPYLPAAKKAKEAKAEAEGKDPAAPQGAASAAAPESAGEIESGRTSESPPPEPTSATTPEPANAEAAAPPPEKPWWETGENLHEVKLEDLSADADGVLARRMVKGFYVAVDKTFTWHGRTWYKTTKGLVVPADRFWKAAEPEFQGVEIDGEKLSLPVAWVYGANKQSLTYEYDAEKKKLSPKGAASKFTPVPLSGKTETISGKEYAETKEGAWIRASHIRRTTPEPRPSDIGEADIWFDIDLSEQTLVLFEGDRPLYATMISSGKESKIKDKDHSTPRGKWRVREKHVVTTMDGNGTAAGDLPYSIEDVPYVMYFHKAFALHGAFWHQNFGSQMSHGCVNLAPLDAKWLFFHSTPKLPEGLHGVWSTAESPGSWVVIHD